MSDSRFNNFSLWKFHFSLYFSFHFSEHEIGFVSHFVVWNKNAPLFQEHSCKFQLNPLSKCWVREQTHVVKFTLWNENELFIVKYSMKINFDKIFEFSVKIYPYLQILVKNKLKLGEKIKWPNHFKVVNLLSIFQLSFFSKNARSRWKMRVRS